ncbi:gluconate 2-dehydrogenase [Tranquillimonas rosea]|uniref:Gluconate 2-dehydrogenase n=1 Tax=Tranquillimonas rosea TaxID=641238 RepID=A0A1H9RLG5_9RHOB|nr:D-glycerate dehydrogenase [Tranquillimonas rosea]SER73616.1 gluconate 2-dehydrogenase [Tranquillimonas rosea]
MPSLLITRPMPQPVVDALGGRFEVTLRESNVPMDVADCADALARYDAILPTLRDRFTAEAFAGDVRCRILANFGVGTDHIDTDAAGTAGVRVTNTPGAVTDATADIGMMLILMTCRRAGEGERMVRAGQWDGWHPTQLLGMHLGGKTLGIVGMGRIGKAIARRAQAGFGMEVVFHNRSSVADSDVYGRQLDSLTQVAEAADVLVCAVPATPQTRRLIDGDVLSSLGAAGYFVNIARGDIVDEAAMIRALQDGTIAGAGLDVYEREPEVPEALRGMENVVLLPHLGTAALEVRTEMGLMAVRNLTAYLDGETLPNLV